ncbi:CDP-alcohol phosphatidyltransferase family protein [Pseudonocardia aurantiaca]|uniref:CDP-alcohol phosphatidyltransferase family protein n=1 Tax=Pseudonocardia aurantiaca TaxID=75290 RepID=A0ABW4FGL7_9PSEU
MTPANRVQAAAAAGQVILLVGIWLGGGAGPVALVAGVVYAIALSVLLAGALRRAGRASLGPADLVTLGRAGLVGSVTALVAEELVSGASPTPALVGIAAVALALDAVDGRVARRTGTVSAVGARFDMEVDAFLVLVLSVHVAGIVGPWALAIGGMRYVFVAASWVLPWLRGPLPPNLAAKTVAALQGVALVVAAAELLPPVISAGLVAVALALLCWSFGRDVLRLSHPRHAPATGRDCTDTSSGPMRSGTVQPSRSYSAMQRSTMAL